MNNNILIPINTKENSNCEVIDYKYVLHFNTVLSRNMHINDLVNTILLIFCVHPCKHTQDSVCVSTWQTRQKVVNVVNVATQL